MKIRTLVVDHEPLARSRMLALLRKESDIEIVGECEDSIAVSAAIRSAAPDLLFLDLQMPKLDAFGLVRTFDPDRAPAVIFVSVDDKGALRAFQVQALDFLMKPINATRFRLALRHARIRLEERRAAATHQRQDTRPEIRPRSQWRDRLVVQSSGRIYVLRTADIDWCEAAGNYVRLHVGEQGYAMRRTMGYLESILDPQQFIRIHLSSIVNVDCVRELDSSSDGLFVLLRGGERLVLSSGYRDRLQSRLDNSLCFRRRLS